LLFDPAPSPDTISISLLPMNDVIEVGQRVGPYTVTRRIGSGGLGTVFAADGPDGLVALKLVNSVPIGGEDASAHHWTQARALLTDEIAAAQRAAGPGVVRVLDADLDHQPPYLVMELVDQLNLYEHVGRHGPLAGAVLDRFATSLLTAMSHIHLAGIVHGDLKPTNVLVSADGSAHVVDFGLAALAQQTSSITDTAGRGTPGWRAPEVEAGEAPTIAADAYGWGRVVEYAAGFVLPVALQEKVDAALSIDVARRRAVYVPPAFPIADARAPDPSPIPETQQRSALTTSAPGNGHPKTVWKVAGSVALAAVAALSAWVWFSGRNDNERAIDPTSLVVFDEGFRNGFTLNEFNGINNPASTIEAHSGSVSLATTPTAFDGFLLWIPDGLKLADRSELRLWMLVDPADSGEFRMSAMINTQQAAGRAVTVGPLVPGQWSEVVMPLNELIVDRAAFDAATKRMLWCNSAVGTSRLTVFVDDISIA
jgi:serine/threonine protein kinase